MFLTRADLIDLQQLPLELKIEITKNRIKEWYDHWNGQVYIAFSGGKDSTVLLSIVRELYSEVPAVFVDTGLQFPEIKKLIKKTDNVVVLRPSMGFRDVLTQYGYPVISKRVARYVYDLQHASDKNKATCHLRLTGYNRAGKYCPSMKLSQKWQFLVDAPFPISSFCCDVMKKRPLHKYVKQSGRYPIIGTMASDSGYRAWNLLKHGCNMFELANSISAPLSLWTEQDILEYIRVNSIEICSVYGDIIEQESGKLSTTKEHNTGCIYCAFGIQYDRIPNRFQRMKVSHPNLYFYCMTNLGMKNVLEYIGVPYE